MHDIELTIRALGPPPDGVGGLEALGKTVGIAGSRRVGGGSGMTTRWRGRAGPASGIAIVFHDGGRCQALSRQQAASKGKQWAVAKALS